MSQPLQENPLHSLDDRTDPTFTAIYSFMFGDRLEPPAKEIQEFEQFKDRRTAKSICDAARALESQGRGADVLAYVQHLLSVMRSAKPMALQKRDRIIVAYLEKFSGRKRATEKQRIIDGGDESPLNDTFNLLNRALDLVVSRAAKVVSWLMYEDLNCLFPLNDYHSTLVEGVTGVISGHPTEENWARIDSALATADIARQRGGLPQRRQMQRTLSLPMLLDKMEIEDPKKRRTWLKRWHTQFERRDEKLRETGDAANMIAADGTLPLEIVVAFLWEKSELKEEVKFELLKLSPARVVVRREEL